MRATSTSSLSALSSAQYIVGTPAKIVTSCSTMRFSAISPVNRGTRTSVAAVANPPFMRTVAPKVWKRGSVTSMVSARSGVVWNRRLQPIALRMRFECESSAPFGWPVVPEV